MILEKGRSLFVARHFQPDICIFDSHASVGCEDTLGRRVFLVVGHLFDFVIFFEFLHFLASVGSRSTERFLCFFENCSHRRESE